MRLRTGLLKSTIALALGACAMPTGTGDRPASTTGAQAPTYQVQVEASPSASPRLRARRYPWWRYRNYHAPAADCVPPLPTGMVIYNASVENELLTLLNQARTAAGAPALALDDRARIRAAARIHSYEVSGPETPGNNSPDGKTPGDRLLQYCVGYRHYGESVYRIPREGATAESIFNVFMADASAKAVLMNPVFTQVGIGVYPTQPPRRFYYVTIDLVQP